MNSVLFHTFAPFFSFFVILLCVFVFFFLFFFISLTRTHSPFRMRECFTLNFNETIESIKPVLFMIFNVNTPCADQNKKKRREFFFFNEKRHKSASNNHEYEEKKCAPHEWYEKKKKIANKIKRMKKKLAEAERTKIELNMSKIPCSSD